MQLPCNTFLRDYENSGGIADDKVRWEEAGAKIGIAPAAGGIYESD